MLHTLRPTHATPGTRTSNATPPVNLLLFAAAPLALDLLRGGMLNFAETLVQLALLALSVWAITAGIARRRAFDAAEAARRPRLPRLCLGAGLLGFLVFLLSTAHVDAVTAQIALGISATLLSLAAFGIDPLRHKGLDDPDYIARCDAEAVLATADDRLREIVARVALLGEDDLKHRSEAVRGAILRILRANARDPREMLSLKAPIARILDLADAECDALETGWARDSNRAARRFNMRLAALCEAFETRTRERRDKSEQDAFGFETDLLLERMDRRHAA